MPTTTSKSTRAKRPTSAATATRKRTVTATAVSPLGNIPAGSNRRADIEKMLLDLGVTEFEFRQQVPLEEFDREKSLSNQARFKHVDPEVAARYTEAMKRGDVFPPVIAWRRGRKLIMSDGNHRLVSATAAEAPALDAYEVRAPGKTLAVLTMLANTKHGLPTNLDERVSHAIYLMDSDVSMAQAAERLNIPVKEIQKRWNKVSADRRANDVGILMTDWDKLNQGVRLRLANISTDEGFEAATKLALAAGITSEEVHSLVTQLNETRSGTRQKKIVSDLEAAYAERIQANAGGVLGKNNSRKSMSPKSRFGMAMASLSAIPDDISSLAAAFAEAERADAARRARENAGKLEKLAAALEG